MTFSPDISGMVPVAQVPNRELQAPSRETTQDITDKVYLAEDVATMRIVALNSDNLAVNANSNTIAHSSSVYGLALDGGITGDWTRILVKGLYRWAKHGFTVGGNSLFLKGTTGEIAQTEPTEAESVFWLKIGDVISTNWIRFDIDSSRSIEL